MTGQILYPSGPPLVRVDRGNTFPPNPQPGDDFYREDLAHRFEWDATRSKWLGGSETVEFNHLVTVTNNFSSLINTVLSTSKFGQRWGYDMQIVGIRFNCKTASSCTMNAVIGVAGGPAVVLSAANFGENTTANANVAAGTVLTAFITGSAQQAHRISIELRRTAT